MSQLVLIPWGRTDWDDQHRFVGHTDVAINQRGREQAARVAQEIVGLHVASLYRAPEEAARQTADIIGAALGLKVREAPDLHEVNLGLWQGLTESEFRERYPSVHRQWHEDPTSVEPPNGELLVDAAARLLAALSAVLRRRRARPMAIVTGPMAVAALSLTLSGQPLTGWWAHLNALPAWRALPMPPARSRFPAPPRP